MIQVETSPGMKKGVGGEKLQLNGVALSANIGAHTLSIVGQGKEQTLAPIFRISYSWRKQEITIHSVTSKRPIAGHPSNTSSSIVNVIGSVRSQRISINLREYQRYNVLVCCTIAFINHLSSHDCFVCPSSSRTSLQAPSAAMGGRDESDSCIRIRTGAHRSDSAVRYACVSGEKAPKHSGLPDVWYFFPETPFSKSCGSWAPLYYMRECGEGEREVSSQSNVRRPTASAALNPRAGLGEETIVGTPST
ncbi:hypothetical protein CONPUDRAFT_144769 [Coniophora puteana RWD-64-598 SS2]|uniref:Uncharacterized protein n=1 Tax=Coniophora puteana (strain RWD-64-598) TaxID=741705 RepID=A0A5M3MKK6_CONPW|nr:uncharacterized protein CONPUDRAFT_144769 [Coniophora puteana RWD-64-598 SS2]EIW79500.1 hypothetical protein CONPUDRAFT_144769 [Coniophora puteana RWD-64-598 SS2]